MLAVVRAGVDRDGFAIIYAEHRDAMVRLAFLLTSDAHRAEEVVAEAFVKVWKQWRAGEVRQVRPYLRRAVVNEANSSLRRRYLERRVTARRTGDDRGVLHHDEEAAARDELWQAIARLPERQRHVVVLRFYEDLTVADTAAVLGVSEGTVKSQSSKAFDRLGTVLSGASAGPAGEGVR